MIHHSTENRSNSLGPYEVMLVPVPGANLPTRICAWRSTDFSLYETHPDCVFISIENSKDNAGTYIPGWDLEDGRAIRREHGGRHQHPEKHGKTAFHALSSPWEYKRFGGDCDR